MEQNHVHMKIVPPEQLNEFLEENFRPQWRAVWLDGAKHGLVAGWVLSLVLIAIGYWLMSLIA